MLRIALRTMRPRSFRGHPSRRGLRAVPRGEDQSAFGMAEGILRKVQIVPIGAIGQCARMQDHLLTFIPAAFLLAGFVKGVIGLGLPTVSMGLLAVTMAPGQAIAIVIVPAIVTNVWQTLAGLICAT